MSEVADAYTVTKTSSRSGGDRLGATPVQDISLTARSGAAWHTGSSDGTVYNLFNGTTAGSGASSLWPPQEVWSQEVLNATGSGSVTINIDMSG
jgi:hypothetical protein